MATVVPTEGQLQAAFAHERKPYWPESLAEAMLDPLYSRIVTLHAKLLAMGRDPAAGSRVNHRPEVIAPEPPHPAEPPAPRIARPPTPAKPRRAAPPPMHPRPLVDLKRAAGGDDDD